MPKKRSLENAGISDAQYLQIMEGVAERNYKYWGFPNSDAALLDALNNNPNIKPLYPAIISFNSTLCVQLCLLSYHSLSIIIIVDIIVVTNIFHHIGKNNSNIL